MRPARWGVGWGGLGCWEFGFLRFRGWGFRVEAKDLGAVGI